MFKQIWTPALGQLLWLLSALVSTSLLVYCQSLCSGLPKIFLCCSLSSILYHSDFYSKWGLLQNLWVGLESSDLRYFLQEFLLASRCYLDFWNSREQSWVSFFLTSKGSTLHLQYLCRVRTVGSKTEKYVQVTGLCARRQSGSLLLHPSNFPAGSLTITLSLHRQWHLWSSTAPGSPEWSSQCQVFWIGVYPVTLCGWEWTSCWTWYFGALGFLLLISMSNLSFCLSCASTYTILFFVTHYCIGTSGEIRTRMLFSSLGQIVCWVKNCSQRDTEFYWEIIAFSSKNYRIASREFTYNSEDTETTGEEKQAFLVSRYFVIITLCKNEELTWIYFVPPPLTYPHVFFWCLGNGLCRWKSSFSLLAISDWNDSLSVISFLPFFPSSPVFFLFTQSKTRSIFWFLTCSRCC